MGIKLKTPIRELMATIDDTISGYQKKALDDLVLIGNQCLQIVRSEQGYINQLGNLYGSTGFIVGDHGKEYRRGGFEEPNWSRFLSGTVSPAYLALNKPGEGVVKGPSFAIQLLSEYNDSMVLIFVAGMEYATRVEAMGKNVITSGELWAEQNARRILNSMNL